MKRLALLASVVFISALSCTPGPAPPVAAPGRTQKEIMANDTTAMMDGIEYYKNCNFQELSPLYNYHVYFTRWQTSDGDTAPNYHIQVVVLSKSDNRPIDTVEVKGRFLYSSVFENCLKARSYISGKNSDSTAIDNDYGELIVCDFNFDGREDVAIIHESGGNSGPVYNFYIQDEHQRFVPDHFLTDTMEFFPSLLDKRDKKLVTYVHAGACAVGEHTYRYDIENRHWKEVSHKMIDICK